MSAVVEARRARPRMSRSRILVPVLRQPLGAHAVTMAVHLAQMRNTQIVALHVTELNLFEGQFVGVSLAYPLAPHLGMASTERALGALEPILRASVQAGVSCLPFGVDSGRAAEAVRDAAKSLGCDLIVVSSDPKGAGMCARLRTWYARIRLARMVQCSAVPVLIVY